MWGRFWVTMLGRQWGCSGAQAVGCIGTVHVPRLLERTMRKPKAGSSDILVNITQLAQVLMLLWNWLLLKSCLLFFFSLGKTAAIFTQASHGYMGSAIQVSPSILPFRPSCQNLSYRGWNDIMQCHPAACSAQQTFDTMGFFLREPSQALVRKQQPDVKGTLAWDVS